MYLKIIIPVLTFAIGFGAAWSWQGTRGDNAILEQINAGNAAALAQVELWKKVREEKDARYAAVRELEVLKDQEAEKNETVITETRVEYVTKDPNANDCGLSAAGVRVWNSAATGVPETATARPVDYGGPIAARNSEVIRAQDVSAKRHHAAMRQIAKLKSYITEECVQ